MTKAIHVIAALGALILPGCAGVAPGGAPSSASSPTESSGAALGELPAQELGRGQCALVLWSHDAMPTRFLVTLNQPAVARIEVDGKTIELARVAQSGEAVHGQFPSQYYRGQGLSLGVTVGVDQMKGVNGGAIVSSAVVEYVDGKGWTTIIPAAGLIGCQT